MLFRSQFCLLLWKNIITRKRRKYRFAVEIFWPLFIFIITAAIRTKIPRTFEPNCYFSERFLLSSGIFPFLKSFVCEVDDSCRKKPVGYVDDDFKNFSFESVRYLNEFSIIKNLKNIIGFKNSLENFKFSGDDSFTKVLSATPLKRFLPSANLSRTQSQTINQGEIYSSLLRALTSTVFLRKEMMKNRTTSGPRIQSLKDIMDRVVKFDLRSAICGSTVNKLMSSDAKSRRIFDLKYLSSLKICPNGRSECFCANLEEALTLLPEHIRVYLRIINPILTGKIVFAPNTSLVTGIIAKANSTFDRIGGFKRLISDLTHFLTDNQHELNQIGAIIGFDDLKWKNGFETVYQSLDLLNNLMTCVDLDKFMGLKSEKEAVDKGLSLMKKDKFWAAVIFEPNETHPHLITYKIRMNASRTQDTTYAQDKHFSYGPRNCFTCNPYFLHGFIYIQDMIEQAIVSPGLGLGVSAQMSPYPCHISDKFFIDISKSLPLFMVIAWVYTVSTLVKDIVYEKERRLKEFMQIMGLSSVSNKLAWFVTTFTITLLINIIITSILKLSGTIVYTDFSVVLFFFTCFQVATISQCFLISSFFTKSSLASIVAGIVYFLLYLPYNLLTNCEDSIQVWQKIVASMSSTVAFSYGCELLANFELQSEGIHWYNIFSTPITTKGDFSLATTCEILIFDSVIYLLLAWYIEAIVPGKFGVPRRWYFPFTKDYWFKSSRINTKIADSKCESFGLKRMDTNTGVECVNLSKLYKRGRNLALNELSVKFNQNEITGLLGHNGAGKSTLIHILMGLHEPTSGTALINRLDIRENLPDIRKSLGFVPQTDILFSTMTVWEHLWFYSQIRNVPGDTALKQIEQMLTSSELGPYRNQQARRLSGGLRRKLAIAVAFIGDARVVILDEPTAGVDFDGRKSIWSLLSRLKTPDRTIVICTHQMDEVDALCDRCVIMSNGRLVANGTPSDLKKKFGQGYNLTLIRKKSPQMVADCQLVDFVMSRINMAKLVDVNRFEMRFVIPNSIEYTRSYSGFLKELEANLSSLGVESVRLTETSLDDVLVELSKVGEKGAIERNDDVYLFGYNLSLIWRYFWNRPKINEICSANVQVELSERMVSGSFHLVKQQFKALVFKRYCRLKRNVKSFLTETVLPITFICLGVFILNFAPKITNKPALELHPWHYTTSSENRIFFKKTSRFGEMGDRIRDSFFMRPGLGTKCLSKNEPIGCLKQDSVEIKTQDIPFNSSLATPKCGCKNGFLNCDGPQKYPIKKFYSPTRDIIYDLGDADVQDWLIKTDLSDEFLLNRYGGFELIDVEPTSRQFLNDFDKISGSLFDLIDIFGLNKSNMVTKYGDFFKTNPLFPQKRAKIWYNNKGYHANVGYLNTLNNALIRLNSTKKSGIVAFNHPMSLTRAQYMNELDRRLVIDLSVAIFIIFALSFIPASFLVFLVEERETNSKQLQFVSGLRPIIYWVSNFIWDFFNYIPSAVISICIFVLFNARSFTSPENFPCLCLLLLTYGFAIIPFMYPFNFMFKSAGNSFVLSSCLNVFIGSGTMTLITALKIANKVNNQLFHVSELLNKIFKVIFPHYCLGQGLLDLSLLYNMAEVKRNFGYSSSYNPLEFDLIGQNLVWMIVQGVVYFVFNILLQYRSFIYRAVVGYKDIKVESDLEEEADYVRFVKLSKIYKKFWTSKEKIAVNSVTISVKKGECFGLLGKNGAGKTTTFKMLTGEIPITHGDIYVNGKSVKNELYQVYKDLGYCPQNDALFPLLTTREHLEFYAMLRGIRKELIGLTANSLLKRFDLEPFSDRISSDLSEGNKRRLSTSIALVGNPTVICLDEPTSGMDANIKMILKKDIIEIINENRIVILTSHDVNECEVLCNKIGLMEEGGFKFLGGPSEFRQHFKGFYKLSIWVKQPVEEASVLNLRQFMGENFESVKLAKLSPGFLQFRLPIHSNHLSTVFDKLETNRQQLSISDYSIGETTLDDVISTTDYLI